MIRTQHTASSYVCLPHSF